MTGALFARFTRERDGVAAIEFAFVVPVLLTIFFGGYNVEQCVAIGRKVTITTRALADLTSQFASMTATDMSTVINASTQIIAPFNSASLSLRLSEITTNSTGLVATVTWSASRNMTAYVQGSRFTLPVSMQKPNTSYIYSETSYTYAPLAAFGRIGTFGDRIYMLPRISSSVTYSG